MTIGILALQGDFAEHERILNSLNVTSLEVRTVDDLKLVDALILPGGESTTISKLLKTSGLFEAIQTRYAEGTLHIFGTCAGAILLAKKVHGTIVPDSLGLMDITIHRNAYGRQISSFYADIAIQGISTPIPVSFIRAPIIAETGPNVEVLAEHNGNPVLVRQGNCLAATFHSEVTESTVVHELFLTITN